MYTHVLRRIHSIRMKLKPINKSKQNESFKILEKPALMHTRDSNIHT